MRVRTSRSSHTAWSGAPGLACATAVDGRGNVRFYYTGSNIRLYYQSGEDLEKVR